jgi:hypothetical protein
LIREYGHFFKFSYDLFIMDGCFSHIGKYRVDWSGRHLTPTGDRGKNKSGGGSPSPDKYKTSLPERRFFAFLAELAYELEGLAAGAGKVETPQEQSDEEARLPPRGKQMPSAEWNGLCLQPIFL